MLLICLKFCIHFCCRFQANPFLKNKNKSPLATNFVASFNSSPPVNRKPLMPKVVNFDDRNSVTKNEENGIIESNSDELKKIEVNNVDDVKIEVDPSQDDFTQDENFEFGKFIYLFLNIVFMLKVGYLINFFKYLKITS